MKGVREANRIAAEATASANEANSLARYGLLLTAFEAAALVATLIVTACAARSASRAAVAADKAVDVTMNTAKQELRAYVGASKGKWAKKRTIQRANSEVVHELEAIFTITNAGQTPAHDVIAWATIIIPEPDELIDWDDRSGGRRKYFFLNPHEVATWVGEFETSDSDYLSFSQGKLIIYLHGQIDYIDTFGKDQHTWFRLKCAKGTKEGLFEVCDDGNKGT